MKKIVLRSMTLQNFKGVAEQTYTFGDYCNITGGNGTGKSTIYEAYLWCLFGKNTYGNETKVQPLDANNEVKHNLTTSVQLVLNVDGSEMEVERLLDENWSKPTGTNKLILKGTSTTYKINGVPMKQADYIAKLNELLNLDKWFTISSINILPNIDQKTRRAALQSIAPAFDEMALAKQYPAVADALQMGITADQLLTKTKDDKQRARGELDDIPSRIDQQEKLRVNEDFAQLQIDADNLEAVIETTRKQIDAEKNPTEADGFFAVQAKAQRDELAKMTAEITAIENDARKCANEELYAFNVKQAEVENDMEKAKLQVALEEEHIAEYGKMVAQKKVELDALRKEWLTKNGEAMPNYNGNCPTCGQPLPVEKVQEAQEQWKANKVKALRSIQDQAEYNGKKTKEMNEAIAERQARVDELNRQVDELAEKLKGIKEARKAMMTYEDLLASNKNYQEMVDKRDSIMASMEAASSNKIENNEKLLELNDLLLRKTVEISAIRDRLALRETNKHIDHLRELLEKEQKTLSQQIADCEKVEKQVAEFKKKKIAMVEEGVSSLFSIVRWKMYEPNLTNDGEKEICQAIIDGVPYEQQNRATQVNAAVDMIRAFSRAYVTAVPLFIDNAESVSHILDAGTQTLTLMVVPEAKLTITNK